MNFQDVVLNRFTFHKIFGKKIVEQTEVAPYADDCGDFCNINPDGIDILTARIKKAASQKRRFFELDIKETGAESFWKLASPLINASKPDFLKTSKIIADKAASVHNKANTPDGLLLIIEGVISGYSALIVVKAEKSNAFSMTGTSLQLIKDIFLSSDKTLYKIGFLIHRDNKNNQPKSYAGYVYDDAFSPSKEDLAIYFYQRFLGYSTEKNAPINTNNLYNELKAFNDQYIDSLSDRNDILRNIDRKLMDKKVVTLHADDFKTLFPDEVHSVYDHRISTNFKTAIVKDTTLIGDFLTKRIRITSNADLVTKNGISDKIKLGTVRDNKVNFIENLELDTGVEYKCVFVPTTTDIIDTTKDKKSAPKKRGKQ